MYAPEPGTFDDQEEDDAEEENHAPVNLDTGSLAAFSMLLAEPFDYEAAILLWKVTGRRPEHLGLTKTTKMNTMTMLALSKHLLLAGATRP